MGNGLRPVLPITRRYHAGRPMSNLGGRQRVDVGDQIFLDGCDLDAVREDVGLVGLDVRGDLHDLHLISDDGLLIGDDGSQISGNLPLVGLELSGVGRDLRLVGVDLDQISSRDRSGRPAGLADWPESDRETDRPQDRLICGQLGLVGLQGLVVTGEMDKVHDDGCPVLDQILLLGGQISLLLRKVGLGGSQFSPGRP